MQHKGDDSEFNKNVKSAITYDLSGRYQGVKNKLTLDALIDPRFKLVPFLTDDERLEAFHQCKVEAVSISNQKQIVLKQEQDTGTDPSPS